MEADADPFLAELGRRVKDRRAQRSFPLREMAERSGLSVRFLTQLESGRANISVLKLASLAQALGTSSGELLAGLGERPGLPMIALLGVRGAGKTTIGRRLARRLRVPFVELDERVERAAGLPLAEIFRLHGESYYRRMEREALEQLWPEGALVLATGGGLVTSAETFARLKQRAVTVWLRARPEDHWSRVVQQGDGRLTEARPHAMAELRRLLAGREPLYGQAAHRIDTSRMEPDEAARAIEACLESAS